MHMYMYTCNARKGVVNNSTQKNASIFFLIFLTKQKKMQGKALLFDDSFEHHVTHVGKFPRYFAFL